MKILRNILAIILGTGIGMVVNMALVMIGPYVFPVPEGIDITTTEGLKAGMHLMKPVNFIFPFLAHALGTLVGAWMAALIAGSHKKVFAIVVGCLFLVGGILNIIMLPSPIWFTILDLVGAYIPMALLGAKLGIKRLTK